MTDPKKDVSLSEDADEAARPEQTGQTPGETGEAEGSEQEAGKHGRPSDDSDPGHS